MIAEHMADRVAQGVYNYMKQMLKLTTYNEGVVNKLAADSITNLKLVVTPEDIISIKSMVQDKFVKNVEVTPLAELVSGMGGKVLTKKEAAVAQAQRSMQGVGMTPPRMPAMMPKVAVKQETPEAQALKTLKIGFLGKAAELKGQLSLMHGVLTKAFDCTKIEANMEVLAAAGKSCNDKLVGDVADDYDLEEEMLQFNSVIEDALLDIKDGLDSVKGTIDNFQDTINEYVGIIDEAIAEA